MTLLLDDLLAALQLLTRLPVGRFLPAAAPDLSRCVWAFPVIGLIVGLIGGTAYGVAWFLGVPPFLAGGWTLLVMILVTGAFHEDGLADTADGFGGGTTPERKLEIMRDSRIGTYGTLALVLSLLLRASAIGAIARPGGAISALIVAATVGRSAMILPLLMLDPARPDGMAASLGKPETVTVAVSVAVAALAAIVLLPFGLALLVVLLGLGSALAISALAHAQIGGYTGDVLGATELAAECVVLTVIASAWGGTVS